MKGSNWMWARVTVLCTVILILCGSVQAGYVKKWIWTKKEEKKLKSLEKDVKQADGFYVLETEHWISKSQIDAHFTAECGLFMEIFYDVFVKAFPFDKKPVEDVKQTLLVFSSQPAYMAYHAIPGSRGYFAPGTNELVTYMEAGRLLSFSNCYHPVIQHEGTHALFHRFVGKRPIPVWLNEGMATFFEYWDYRSKANPNGTKKKDKKARRKRLTLSYRKHQLRKWISKQHGIYPHLSYVVGLNSGAQWNVDGMGPKTGFHYGAAESVADFIFSSKKGASLLEKMFKRMEESEVGRDEQGYGILTAPLLTDEELKELEPGWHKFLQKVWAINGKAPKD